MKNEWDAIIESWTHHGRMIWICAVVGLILSIALYILLPNKYETTLIVGPNEHTSIPSLSNLLPKTAADSPALSYFVDRIDAAQSNDFMIFQQRFLSPIIASQVMDKYPSIFPEQSKNDLQKWLRKHIKIKPYGLSPFVKISIIHSPDLRAGDLLNQLYETTDQSIRQDKKSQTIRRISYLQNQLTTVKNPDHRQAIISLLREQEQKQMMIAIDHHFATSIIEPTITSSHPVSPNTYLLFAIFPFIGAIVGYVLSNIKSAYARRTS